MKQIIVFIALLLIVACNNIGQNATTENTKKSWNVLRTDGSFLIFNDNSRINTRLYDMTYLESLIDSTGNSYFVLSGRTCKECDENIAIFIVCPQDTAIPLSELPKYTYPGKEYDYENNQLTFESKLFIGNCIDNSGKSACLIWVQKERDRSNKLDSSMFIVDIFNKKIRERSVKPQSQDYTKNLQHLKNCKEIKGVVTTSEP